MSHTSSLIMAFLISSMDGPVCLSVCLSVRPSVRPPVCPSVCLPRLCSIRYHWPKWCPCKRSRSKVKVTQVKTDCVPMPRFCVKEDCDHFVAHNGYIDPICKLKVALIDWISVVQLIDGHLLLYNLNVRNWQAITHYSDVIMGTMASQITSLTTV